MEEFTKRVIKIIASIPHGRIMTYGQIAQEAGSPRGARQVVRILHSMSAKYNLPWHRVVNAKGEIGFTDPESYRIQALSLQNEGIEFSKDQRISLRRYQFHPSEGE
ncbi:MGMT family protein [Aneurinibacillus sp. REN35]|uniref:MGMT family protein n=1 Tax=Aneurinibacillus sp. REN35 TaxID=3237286 RepID=UPI003527C19F